MYCQKCRTPVRLDASVEELNPAAFKLLTDPIVPVSHHASATAPLRQTRLAFPEQRREDYQSAVHDARAPTFKRAIPPGRFAQNASVSPSKMGIKDNPAMSFVMLTESQVVQKPNTTWENGADEASRDPNAPSPAPRLAAEIETTNRLYEILSAHSDIDHPICVECTDLLVEGLQKSLAGAIKERDAYVEYLRRANTDVPSDEERQQGLETLGAARKQEASSFARLETLEREKALLDNQIAALDVEARELDQMEQSFWHERNSFAGTLSAFQDERDRLNTRYDHDAKQLQRLQRTNVYNDTFCIGHDGFFGTINGLRLGRLSNPLVEWAEINAAWGQTCLLLATVAERLGFSFKGYRIIPRGSSSQIEKLEYPQSPSGNDPSHPVKPKVTKLDLYSTGEMGLGFFLHRRIDAAMIAFLECLRQLGDFVEQPPTQGTANAGHGLRMPYEIHKDKIHDTSIKLTFQQEESWTKACKYTLTCCKYLLAHASNTTTPTSRRNM
ncbi:autophagy protein Apg6 [Mytilinidion resinicola]|uniref:Autophagy protein Apg6 n=1 Tax=Mytilinidion resinicola TaxID=574789 RepID=A0A6A6YDC3_9PEZI|nr:autophagy protein Apg6 [Mytilinidion resinicola]KAF2806599.1 autophagy protein Apg6 [Mytilinidion resinicola]